MGFKKIENTIQDMRIKKKEKIDEKKKLTKPSGLRL